MRRLVIAVDCDDVLIHTAEATINAYNLRYKTNVTLKHWYDTSSLEPYGTTTTQEAIDRVYEYQLSAEHAALRPDPATVAAVNQLAEKHELHVVTGRARKIEPVTMKMLDDFFPGIFQSVEHTAFYGEAKGDQAKKRSKGEVCKEIRADILIDDHIVHGRDVLKHGVKKVLLFGNYPWNAHDDVGQGIVRCKDWNEVLRQVDLVASE